MSDATTLLSLSTGLLSLTTLAALIRNHKLARRAASQQFELKLKKSELENFKDAHAELERASWSIRNIFDHFGTYVDADEKLVEFLWRLGTRFPKYVHALPGMLTPLGPQVSQEERNTAKPNLPFEFRDNEELDLMVRAINDPVFNRLWAVRTPAAISEMLRHGIFLSFGYTHAVAAWSPEGVNLEIKNRAEPGYTNWGCRTLESLDSFDQLWKHWRSKESPYAAAIKS